MRLYLTDRKFQKHQNFAFCFLYAKILLQKTSKTQKLANLGVEDGQITHFLPKKI